MKRCKIIYRLVAATMSVLLAGTLLAGCGVDGPASGVKNLTDKPQAVVCLDGTKSNYDQVKEFTFSLFDKSLEKKNPVLSPASVYFAMGMTGAGADGITEEEFATVFGNSMIPNAEELMKELPQMGTNLKVNIANSVWVDDDMEAREDWVALVAEYYKSEIFQTNLPNALDNINAWAKEKTEGLIDAILSEPLEEDARLVLMNAIYFNGKWVTPFEAEATRTEAFVLEGDMAIQTDMMRAYGEYFSYVKNDTLDGVVLPYQGDEYVFVALKPTAGQNVREMYESLTAADLELLLSNQQEDTYMDLKLPKFQVEFERDLKEDFINLGLSSAFSPGEANFNGLGNSADGLPLYISKVKQKAVIIVDEEGTEAAAVTAVVDAAGGAMPNEEPIEVFFDEPFLYMIYHSDTGVPLFVGILDEPGAQCQEMQ